MKNKKRFLDEQIKLRPGEIPEAVLSGILAHEERKKQMVHHSSVTENIDGYKRTKNWDDVTCPSCLRGRPEN